MNFNGLFYETIVQYTVIFRLFLNNSLIIQLLTCMYKSPVFPFQWSIYLKKIPIQFATLSIFVLIGLKLL